MKYADVADVLTFLEYVERARQCPKSMHDNPVLIHYGMLMYPPMMEVGRLLYLYDLQLFKDISPVFYHRDGKVHVDEFSYYVSAVIERYKVCQ